MPRVAAHILIEDDTTGKGFTTNVQGQAKGGCCYHTLHAVEHPLKAGFQPRLLRNTAGEEQHQYNRFTRVLTDVPNAAFPALTIRFGVH